jgi:monoamine oxidase
VASEKQKVSPKVLAQSLFAGDMENEPVILFAGEATHDKFLSYAHGAVSSGWRVGNELTHFSIK